MTANRIYFVQHGLAVDKTENPERPLSESGIKQTSAVAKQMQQAALPVDIIFHSGKLRAQQTAEIFAAHLNVSGITEIAHLSPNDDIKLMAQELNSNNALYVGHLPHLEKLVSYLVCKDTNANIIKFYNSAVVCLEINNGLYQIQAYLTPDLLLK